MFFPLPRALREPAPAGALMAVYTEVGDEALARFLEGYDLGAPLSLKGIAEGVENSNYLLHTERGDFILTLYEKRVDEADLPFFLGLMEHLARRGVNCPQPVRARDGAALGRLAGRAAAIVTFLEGLSVRRPTVAHCGEVGEALARMHAAGADFALRRRNALSIAGWPASVRGRAGARRRGRAGSCRGDGSANCARFRRSGRRTCRPASSTPICFPTTCFFSTTSCPA